MSRSPIELLLVAIGYILFFVGLIKIIGIGYAFMVGGALLMSLVLCCDLF